MNKNRLLPAMLLTAIVFSFNLAGCQSDNPAGATAGTTDTAAAGTTESAGAAAAGTGEAAVAGDNTVAAEAADSQISLNGTSITAGEGVVVDGPTATITAAGTYQISGKLDDGQLLVDTAGAVTLILDNADITCTTSAPLYIKEAENITITLAAGSANSITDGANYLPADATEPDAALYSKADMIITGDGALTVNASYNDAIAGRDTLLIENGSITIKAANHGIKGKDYLMINGGTITVDAGGDGIKSTNDTESALGYVEINSGTLQITAADEGISAVTGVTVTGGDITVTTENNGIKTDGPVAIAGATVNIKTADDGIVCLAQTISDTAIVTVNGELVK